jgi:hypothetical protein
MFCGQCGRAITSADVAAFRAQQAAEADSVVEAAAAEIPAWAPVDEPRSDVAPGTPWWVAERTGAEAEPAGDVPAPMEPVFDDDDDLEGVDDVAVEAVSAEPVPTHTPTPTPEPTPKPEPEPETAAEAEPIPEQPAEAQPVGELAAEVAPPAPAPEAPRLESAPARPEPAPLRPPGRVSTSTGRPTSAPLWTASITPITEPEAEPESEPEAEAEPKQVPASESPQAESVGEPPSSATTDEAPGNETPADETPADEVPTNETPADEAPAVESDPAGEPAAQPEAGGDTAEPRPGDTNVIPPLVAPGSARPVGLRCTVCGAALSPDDIFCGECGTVVESVAQSFTGPITPITTGSIAVPPSPAPVEQDPATSAPTDDGTAHAAPAPAPAPRPAPLAPTPVPPASALPPFVPDPEPAPKKRRLFGRRAQQEAPKLWSEPARTSSPAASDGSPVPPMPQGAPATAPAADETPAAPPVGVDRVPRPVETAPVEPAPAPLHATPVDAPPQTAEPVPAPVPPAPASPDRAPWVAAAFGDDLENTRIVARRPLGEAFVLQFSTGESFTVQATGLVGRAPTPQPGESIDLLVRIVDPGKSVSKTHLEFGQTDGALWVSDRWSGNGTVVRPPEGAARRAEPGKRVVVPRGSRVEIGEQFFIVS